jgi:hypothetical protein
MPTLRRIAPALIAGCSVLLCAGASSAAAAEPVSVIVRVQGESGTLLPATPVTVSAPEPVSGCPPNSVAAAINVAVSGNWDHGEANGGGGDFTETILGETHAFTHEADTWAEWVDDKWGGGICTDLLTNGEEVLMVADHEPEPFFAPTALPLVMSAAPQTVTTGAPFKVTVSAIHTAEGTFPEPGQGTPEPAQRVSVTAGEATAMTDAGGEATLTISVPGSVTLQASKPGYVPALPATLCVTPPGADCAGPLAPPGTTAAAVTQASGVQQYKAASAPYSGPYAIVAKATGIRDGHVYRRSRAPRILSGTVIAHTAVSSVELELRRTYRGRCSAYDGVHERFRRARCGHGRFFKVSSSNSFSYLLPAALARGRYVLDLRATDIAGNHTTLVRGTSRIVFYVR